MTASLRERLFSRLIIDPETGCLNWTGHVNTLGYGRINAGGRDGRGRRVHRVMYEMFAGPIPDGLQLDHLCRNTRCASPAHLEPVTSRENLLRGLTVNAANAAKTQCGTCGSPFDEANTYRRSGRRECRACHRAATARYRARKRASS